MGGALRIDEILCMKFFMDFLIDELRGQKRRLSEEGIARCHDTALGSIHGLETRLVL